MIFILALILIPSLQNLSRHAWG